MRYIKPYNEEIDFGKLVPGFLKKKQEDPKEEPKKLNPKEKTKNIDENYINDVISKCFKSFGASFKSTEQEWSFPVNKFKTDFIENNPVKEINVSIENITDWRGDQKSYTIKYTMKIKFENNLVGNRVYLVGKSVYMEGNYVLYETGDIITFSGYLEEDSNNIWKKFDIVTKVVNIISSCKNKLEDEILKDKFRDEFNEIIPELKDLVSDIDDFANDHDYKIINNQFHCIFDIEVGVIPISLNVESKSRISVGNFKFKMNKELSEIFLLISQLQPRIKHIDSDITAEVEFESKHVTIIFTKPTDVFNRKPRLLGPYPPHPW